MLCALELSKQMLMWWLHFCIHVPTCLAGEFGMAVRDASNCAVHMVDFIFIIITIIAITIVTIILIDNEGH